MSTVLDAIRELERSDKSPGQRLPSPKREERRRRWRLIATIAALVIAGTAAASLLIGGREPSPPATETAASALTVAPQLGAADARVERPGSEPPAGEEQPWGRVLDPGSAQPASAAAPVQQAKPRPAAAPKQSAARQEARSASRQVSVPASGSQVQVASISYSDSPAARSVRLLVDGRDVNLREGEVAEGLEVQLILRDQVYLRRGATVFAVRP